VQREVVVLLATAAYCVIHSLLATDRVKRLAVRLLGDGAPRWYRLGYNAFAVVSLLPLAALVARTTGRDVWVIPKPLVYLTSAVQFVCLAGMVWTIRLVGAGDMAGLGAIRNRPTIAQGGLVIRGPYRIVRHPLYSFGLGLIWLAPAMTTTGLVVSLVFSAYLMIGTIVEEHRLVREFGDEYEDYRSRTPRLIPWPITGRR
jgi:protein-S-isoprenylcysteine O-methyltransferase Ste14